MTGDTCKYSLVYIHGPSLASDGEIAALHTGECNLVEFSVVVRWIRESENFLDSTACCGLHGVLLLSVLPRDNYSNSGQPQRQVVELCMYRGILGVQ